MRADHKHLVLGVTLAGAIVGAMSVLIGEVKLSGFVDSQAQVDQAIAVAHNVAGVTSVDAMKLKTGEALDKRGTQLVADDVDNIIWRVSAAAR
jgi:hypothetical protein